MMRMSRERLFALADRIVADLTTSEGVVIRATDEEKARGQLRTEVFRVLEDETKVRGIDRPGGPPHPQYLLPLRPEGSAEWEILYRKTRDEVHRRRFRL